MREIVLDTETTGLKPAEGHRLVEIGCVELLNHMPTGRVFHEYLNPGRDMPEEAFRVHGLSEAFLADKPLFPEVAEAFLAFIAEAPLVIHNAAFDLGFINAELALAGLGRLPDARAIDTVRIARAKFPGSPASLDALCRRFGVDNSGREKHGALLDAELLAEVYLELIGGREPGLVLEPRGSAGGGGGPGMPVSAGRRTRPVPLSSLLTEEERRAHDAFVEGLGDDPLWRHASRT